MTIAPAPNVSVPETTAPISEQAAGPVSQQVGTPTNAPNQPKITGPVSSQDEPSEGTQPQAEPLSLPATPTLGAGQTQQTPAQVTQLSQQIAQAISLGLSQAPTTMAGWAQLADYYSTPAGEESIENAQAGQLTASGQPGSSASAAPASSGTSTSGPAGLSSFLAAIRQHESGGNYSAYNAGGGASGAYQFIQSTWTSEANAAGFSQYANEPAGDAPPSVQDAVASHMAQGYYSQYGNWGDVAEAWYDPADVGKNVVPDPGAGNTESVTDYGSQILAMMGQQPNQDAGSPLAGSSSSVVKLAQSQLGVPYQWGGESAGQDFDCSGLVQWVYKQAGVALPRVAQNQYDATAKLPKNAQLQPGDLVFFGSGPKAITHVGIYIGNGQMIDAPHTGADVRVDSNFQSWGDYVGATRPNDPSGSTTIAPSATIPNTTVQAQESYAQILNQVSTALQGMYSLYPMAGMTGAPEEIPQ